MGDHPRKDFGCQIAPWKPISVSIQRGGAPILASYSSLSWSGTENLWGGGWTLQWFPKGLADVTASPVLLG